MKGKTAMFIMAIMAFAAIASAANIGEFLKLSDDQKAIVRNLAVKIGKDQWEYCNVGTPCYSERLKRFAGSIQAYERMTDDQQRMIKLEIQMAYRGCGRVDSYSERLSMAMVQLYAKPV